jgi:hypothetical protein
MYDHPARLLYAVAMGLCMWGVLIYPFKEALIMMLLPYWELNLFAWLLVALVVTMFTIATWEWWKRERVFRKVARHMGTTYDASVKMQPRPNVRLVRP